MAESSRRSARGPSSSRDSSPERVHPASRSPGHSRPASITSIVDAVPTDMPSIDEEEMAEKLKDEQAARASDDGAPASSVPAHMYPEASTRADTSPTSAHFTSPLRQETAKSADFTGARVLEGRDGRAPTQDMPLQHPSQVTFSIPANNASSSHDGIQALADKLREEAGSSSHDTSNSSGGTAPTISAPSQETLVGAHSSGAGTTRRPPGILKGSPSPVASRRSSLTDEKTDSNTATSQSINFLCPSTDESPRRSRSLIGSGTSSRGSSPAPGDRTRTVGKGGYGGRQGGPGLDKSRTSSSGGLSDSHIGPGYERKVGFDTMPDADDTPTGYFNFCLQVKSRGYRRTKNTRTFMCAVDDNHYSERALEWLMESLVSDGDEIVAVRVLDCDPDTINQDEAREEARELMASVVQLNDEYGDRSISIVVEFVAGRVTETILKQIYMYRPDSLTVGTKGRSISTIHKMFGGSFIGSHSRDILNSSPVPVVIVRPEAKVKKHLAKRANDPKRRSYHDLVALSKDEHLPLSVHRNGAKGKHKGRKGHSPGDSKSDSPASH